MDLQALVDSLAAEIGQPVGVDDRSFRAVAYSSHDGSIDEVRKASILRRQAPPAVIEWLDSLGVAGADEPVQVPANKSLGMAARICVPLRLDDTLLGYLWLLDDPDPLSPGQLDQARSYAAEIGLALRRSGRGSPDDREQVLLELLLGGEAAAAETEVDDLLSTASTYAVLVLAAVHPESLPTPEGIRLRLIDAAALVRRKLDLGRLLVGGGEKVTCVLACGGPDDVPRQGRELISAAAKALEALPGWQPVVGCSEPIHDLGAIPRAREQAREAQRLGALIDRVGDCVLWEELGSYGTLATLLAGRDPNGLLPPSVRQLLESREAATLVPTLERYLDCGGDARAAAAELHLHRSSLYARLRRIEDVAEVDLHSGDDRLDLHVGLRLHRLAGGSARGGLGSKQS